MISHVIAAEEGGVMEQAAGVVRRAGSQLVNACWQYREEFFSAYVIPAGVRGQQPN
jgi:hypothetical protein